MRRTLTQLSEWSEASRRALAPGEGTRSGVQRDAVWILSGGILKPTGQGHSPISRRRLLFREVWGRPPRPGLLGCLTAPGGWGKNLLLPQTMRNTQERSLYGEQRVAGIISPFIRGGFFFFLNRVYFGIHSQRRPTRL